MILTKNVFFTERSGNIFAMQIEGKFEKGVVVVTNPRNKCLWNSKGVSQRSYWLLLINRSLFVSRIYISVQLFWENVSVLATHNKLLLAITSWNLILEIKKMMITSTCQSATHPNQRKKFIIETSLNVQMNIEEKMDTGDQFIK